MAWDQMFLTQIVYLDKSIDPPPLRIELSFSNKYSHVLFKKMNQLCMTRRFFEHARHNV